MKRRQILSIDVIKHLVHREASKGGVPECFMRREVANAPFEKVSVKQLAKAPRRKS